MAKQVPDRIVRKDKELQKKAEQSAVALAELRYECVKVEGYSAESYGRAVDVDGSTIRRYVRAYDMWRDDTQEFDSWSDCYALAKYSEERREIARVVAKESGIPMSGLSEGNEKRPEAKAAREVIRDIQAKVNEAKAEGQTFDIKAEAEKAVQRSVIANAADRAAAKAAAEKRERDSLPDITHVMELIAMRGKLLKWGKEWDAEKISVKNKNFLLATLGELTEAIETVTSAIDGSWEVDWDAELESLVKSNG